MSGARVCSIDGCDKPHYARGWCSMHHWRWRHHGDPTKTIRIQRKGFVLVGGDDECWLWHGHTVKGYGSLRVNGRHVYAHRLVYEEFVGPIPAGMELDHRHTCPKRCCNPYHLRPATRKQNVENHAGPPRNNTSGVRGVSFHRASGLWHATVGHNGRTYSAGYFRSLAAAEAAVIAKRNELHTHNDLDRLPPPVGQLALFEVRR